MRSIVSILLMVVMAFASVASARQATGLREAVPVDPIATILDAFRTYELVCLGEGEHGSEQDQAFRLSLIRDARFANSVNDIVMETGNSKYQDIMDRYVRGENVPDRDLRQVWENTTVAHAGADNPVYEDFYRGVREVNAALPKERQLRVLLGDPPIDWDRVRNFEDIVQWGDQRDPFAADIIDREVLRRGRRALVIYGKMHCERKNDVTNFETSDLLAGILETGGAKVFTIFTGGRSDPDLKTLQTNVGTWRKPSLTLLRGTIPGALDFGAYFTSDRRFSMSTGKPVPISQDRWRKMPMEDLFDAVLYLATPQEIEVVPLSRDHCSDERYMQMRLGRMALVPGNTQAMDRLKRYCASLAPR
jgi:hypothetical protein